MAWYKKVAFILAAIGAINWGLTTLGWNAVHSLIATWSPTLALIVYYLVALSGIWVLVEAFRK